MINKPIISIITAISDNNIIGKDNTLPWYIPSDLKYFKSKTNGKTVIMGRKTFESFKKPLPNRVNIIITSQSNYNVPDGCVVVNSLKEAIEYSIGEDEVFIIGGKEIYSQSISIADIMYITNIKHIVDGDTEFPYYNKNEWKLIESSDVINDNGYDLNFNVYIRYDG